MGIDVQVVPAMIAIAGLALVCVTGGWLWGYRNGRAEAHERRWLPTRTPHRRQ